MNHTSNRVPVALALCSYLALVFWLSHQSRPPMPDALLRVSDKLLHFAEYAPVGFFWARLVGPGHRGRVFKAILLSALCAVADEIHQRFVPGREPSVFDLAADVAGAAAGAGLAASWERWSAGRRARRSSKA